MTSNRGFVKLSYHSKLRYVQRILNIENTQEAERHLKHNYQEVSFEIWNKLTNSTLYHENFNHTGESGRVVNVYIFKDILFYISQENTLITVWKIHHGSGVDYEQKLKLDLSKINDNKNEIGTGLNKAREIGVMGGKREFAITCLYELIAELEDSGNDKSIPVIKKRIEELWKERNKLKEDGSNIMLEVKNLKKQNRQIMRDIMYGFVL